MEVLQKIKKKKSKLESEVVFKIIDQNNIGHDQLFFSPPPPSSQIPHVGPLVRIPNIN